MHTAQIQSFPSLGGRDQENGKERKPRGVQDPRQAVGPAKEAEEPDVRRQLQGHLYVHADKGHELPNEDGRCHVHHSQGTKNQKPRPRHSVQSV